MADVDAGRLMGTLKRVARVVPFSKQALAMYYATLDRNTPMWVKASVAGALAYFLLPIDAIPDMLVVVGYTDDAALLLGTYTAVSKHVTDQHHQQAQDWLDNNV